LDDGGNHRRFALAHRPTAMRFGQWFGLMAASVCLASVDATAFGQPMPPPRPRDLGVETPMPGQDKPPAAPLSDIDMNHPVRRLEQAELRERMRGCAAKWVVMKREGATANLLWSDFARDCLDRN
jgi:hypothetical protein